MNRLLYILLICAALMGGVAFAPQMAFAADGPSWKALPLACLPDRAVPWNSREVSEADQASCHCPPPALCPAVAFSGPVAPASIRSWPSSTYLPPEFVQRCCPEPVCPSGTDLAGQSVPYDGNCNKPRCAAGTDYAGQLIPADGNCNKPRCPAGTDFANQLIPADGKCNLARCPTGTDFAGQLVPADGKCNKARCPTGTDYAGQLIPNSGSCNRPRCPSGTDLAGQLLPANGDCNRPRCAAGTDLAFQTMPSNGKCNTCPNNQPKKTLTIPGTTTTTCSGHDGNICRTTTTPARSFSGCSCPSGYTQNGNICQPRVWPEHVQDCLRGDSLVTLANGKHVPVTQVKVGDVLSGPDGDAVVTQTNHLSTPDALYYRINNRKIAITGEHPILTSDGWKATDDTGTYAIVKGRLDEGDVIPLAGGKTLKVESITVLKNDGKVQNSVNIGTKDNKSFYVDGIPVKPFNDINFKY